VVASVAKAPLTSTLVMEQRVTPPPPAAKSALTSTLAMASPYARSQDVPPHVAGQSSPVPAATVAIGAHPAFAAARAMADAAAAATVASTDAEASVAAARARIQAIEAAASASPPRAEVPTVVPAEPKSNAKVVAIVVVTFVVLGVGAYSGFRSLFAREAAPPAPMSVPLASATSTAPATPAASAAPTATAEPAPTAPAAPVAAAAPSSDEPAPRHAAQGAGPSQAAPPATPRASPISVPAPSPPPQPAPVAASAPTTPPTSQGFDPNAARAALDIMNGVLASCRNPGGRTGDGTISVTFTPDGKVDRAMVDEPPFVATPEGACVASRFKQAKMAPFQGAPGSIVYTFHIPN
jgi:hypothetical protein